jgi:hypothetical protein
MSNKIIPHAEVGKVFQEALKKAVHDNFPDIQEGTPEWDDIMAKAARYCYGGLFYGRWD